MENSVCKKISSMLPLYAEGKLNVDEAKMVEEHLRQCIECREKYVKMQAVVKNLRTTYEQMLLEFDRIERQNAFNIREYEIFYSNISPYIDDELSYSESVRFRKYLLKSKPARKGLADAYSLKNAMKKSINKYTDNLKINYSKNIVAQLKKERKEPINMSVKRAVIALGVLVLCITAFFMYVTTTYNNKVSSTTEIQKNDFPEGFETVSSEEEMTDDTVQQNEMPTSDTLADNMNE